MANANNTTQNEENVYYIMLEHHIWSWDTVMEIAESIATAEGSDVFGKGLYQTLNSLVVKGFIWSTVRHDGEVLYTASEEVAFSTTNDDIPF